MKKLQFLAGLLALGTSPSLFGSPIYAYLSGVGTLKDGNYFVSPYTGAIGSNPTGGNPDLAVSLYCDDFNNGASVGQAGWTINATNVSTAAAQANQGTAWSATRFGEQNFSGNTRFPAGTQLYEEMSWLFTQAATQNSVNQIAIQEAVWLLTDPDGTSPSAQGNANTGIVSTWLTAAKNDYNKTVAGYTTANYGNWYVATQTSAAGLAVGGGTQEFLVYSSVNPTTGPVGAPEPSSFVLLATGLLIAGLRRGTPVSNRNYPIDMSKFPMNTSQYIGKYAEKTAVLEL